MSALILYPYEAAHAVTTFAAVVALSAKRSVRVRRLRAVGGLHGVRDSHHAGEGD